MTAERAVWIMPTALARLVEQTSGWLRDAGRPGEQDVTTFKSDGFDHFIIRWPDLERKSILKVELLETLGLDVVVEWSVRNPVDGSVWVKERRLRWNGHSWVTLWLGLRWTERRFRKFIGE